jgi:hypothetical protein
MQATPTSGLDYTDTKMVDSLFSAHFVTFLNHQNWRFEVLTGTQTVSSKWSPNSVDDFKRVLTPLLFFWKRKSRCIIVTIIKSPHKIFGTFYFRVHRPWGHAAQHNGTSVILDTVNTPGLTPDLGLEVLTRTPRSQSCDGISLSSPRQRFTCWHRSSSTWKTSSIIIRSQVRPYAHGSCLYNERVDECRRHTVQGSKCGNSTGSGRSTGRSVEGFTQLTIRVLLYGRVYSMCNEYQVRRQ